MDDKDGWQEIVKRDSLLSAGLHDIYIYIYIYIYNIYIYMCVCVCVCVLVRESSFPFSF